MARRKRKTTNKKRPIVVNQWVLLGIGLWVGLPAAILMPMAYGADAYGFGLGFGTLAACVGSGYVMSIIARHLFDRSDGP